MCSIKHSWSLTFLQESCWASDALILSTSWEFGRRNICWSRPKLFFGKKKFSLNYSTFCGWSVALFNIFWKLWRFIFLSSNIEKLKKTLNVENGIGFFVCVYVCGSLVTLPEKSHECEFQSISSCKQREWEFSLLHPSTVLFQTSMSRERFLCYYLFIVFMYLSPRH